MTSGDVDVAVPVDLPQAGAVIVPGKDRCDGGSAVGGEHSDTDLSAGGGVQGCRCGRVEDVGEALIEVVGTEVIDEYHVDSAGASTVGGVVEFQRGKDGGTQPITEMRLQQCAFSPFEFGEFGAVADAFEEGAEPGCRDDVVAGFVRRPRRRPRTVRRCVP